MKESEIKNHQNKYSRLFELSRYVDSLMEDVSHTSKLSDGVCNYLIPELEGLDKAVFEEIDEESSDISSDFSDVLILLRTISNKIDKNILNYNSFLGTKGLKAMTVCIDN